MSNGEEQVKIIGLTGSFRGSEYFVNKDEFTIGRAKNNDMILNDKTISGNHAKIVKRGEKYEIHDLNSTNGTFVNDTRVTVQPLRTDDIIKFDVMEFKFIHPLEVPRTVVSEAPDFTDKTIPSQKAVEGPPPEQETVVADYSVPEPEPY